jgi:hypothetical protein
VLGVYADNPFSFRQAVEEQQMPQPTVASQHIYQTAHDWQSLLGNFYKFVMDMEALVLSNLEIEQLWSVPCIHGWILWTDACVSGLTSRTRCIKVLAWLQDES